MSKYRWQKKGIWLDDNHNWNMDLDIPRCKREFTGETVVLQPPKYCIREVPPVECKIYYVPEANIYIAIGEKAFCGNSRDVSVMFYDMNSLTAEQHRRYPDRNWVEEED